MTAADKMRAAEKLLWRLSERKKSIIDQVKQRTASYSQHLASKLLIHGINPPPWLRDPTASISKELNEEDLISKLLCQYPQSSAAWSVVARYPGHTNSVVITRDDGNFLDEDFVENSARNEDHDQKNDPAAPGLSGKDYNGECLLDTVPELDANVASPEDRTDERILNIYTAPDQSLARIQRSKSRQKALQLRSSAKASAKSGLRHESSDVVSSQIRFSPSSTNQPGQNNELSALGEPCVTGSQFSENMNVDEAHCLSREMGVDAHSERIIRPETSTVGSIPLGCSSEDYKGNTNSQDARVRRKESIPISDTEHAYNHINKSPKSAGSSAVS